MKKRSLLSILSLILVLVFLLLQASVLTACKKKAEDPEDTTPVTEPEGPVDLPDPHMEYIKSLSTVETNGKPVVLANYMADISDSTDSLELPSFYHMSVDEDADMKASIGFLWNAKTLAVIVDLLDATSISVKVGDHETEISAKSGLSMTKIAFEDIGILPQDLGQLIPVSATASSGSDSATFDGFAQLGDYKVCFSSSCSDLSEFTEAKTTATGSAVSSDVAGIKVENGAIRMYDTYAGGKGKGFTQNKLFVKDLANVSGMKAYIFEVDIRIDSMPEYVPSFVNNKSAYGLCFNISRDSAQNSPFFSIVNTEDGLVLAVVGATSELFTTVSLGKSLGDTFHLMVVWNTNDSLDIVVDGHTMATVENCGAVRGTASKSITITSQRNASAPKSDADNIDVTFNSICLSYDKSKSITDNVDISDLFGDTKVVKLDGDDIYLAPETLNAPAEVSSRTYGLTVDAVWYSSNRDVISHEGVLTSPARSGEFVTYTLLLVSGNTIVTEKEFKFFAKGDDPSTNVAFVKNDSDPFTGKGISADTVFIFDKTMNSVIYDMGEVTDINRVTLKSTKAVGLVNKSFVSLYYSEDGESYTYIKDFSLFQANNEIYFYNIDVNARYIKVHTTLNGAHDKTERVINSLQNMMVAEFTDAPLLAEGDFANTAEVDAKNSSSEEVFDQIFTFSFSDLGISESDLKDDKSDIRFLDGDDYLPYYFDGKEFHVRVLHMAAGETVTIEVLYGNETAESMSDGTETFEIQYGTKYGETYSGPWETSVTEMPNGDLLSMTMSSSASGSELAYYRSTNGGLSWSELTPIAGADKPNIIGGGFIVDKENNKVYYFSYYWEGDDGETTWVCKYHIYVSHDSGYTWDLDPVTPTANKNLAALRYGITYSDGLKVSSYDGAGPGVDYVMTTGMMRDVATKAFATTSIYSKDDGKTWVYSDSQVNYNGGAAAFEGGCSEDALWEQADGTLIFYARCQRADIHHFAISRSTDNGVTWSQISADDFSNIYTTNTQPIIEGLNGTPVLMWGGNNTLGGTSYKRFPLNLATSTDDGETFTNIKNVSFGTIVDTMDPNIGSSLHTNPDLVFYKYHGIDCVYIVSTRHKMYVLNVEDYLYKTKGAYDSFEDGVRADGWQTSRGGAVVSAIGATEGNNAITFLSNSAVVRSLDYIEEGRVSFDFYVSTFGQAAIELQTSFNTAATTYTAPVRLMINENGTISYPNKNGKYVSTEKLNLGDNTISLEFNGNSESVTLTVNGKDYDMGWVSDDNYISYFTVYTTAKGTYSIDRFIAVKNA